MATILEVWSSIAAVVADYNARANSPVSLVPVLVQIDNGYDEPVGPGATPVQPQVLVPPATFLATHGAVEARARQAGQIAFEQEFRIGAGLRFCAPRYVHFALRPHPGPSAPLGWTLSDVSFNDFIFQLGSPLMKQAEQTVANCFSPTWMADQVKPDCGG